MKKAEFVQEVASKVGISKKDTEEVINATLKTIEEILSSGNEISFIGFGSFSTSKRAARQAKVPGTDRIVNVPETRAVKFKVGKSLKEAVAKRK